MRPLLAPALLAFFGACASAAPLFPCDGINQFVADTDELCVYWWCVNGSPIEQRCAKGTRLPSYYARGNDNPCTVKVKKTCSRCNVSDDVIPTSNVTNQCALFQPCATRPGCTCIDQVRGYYCSCPDATTQGPTPPNQLGPLCDVNVCQNGGTCYSLYKYQFCNCPAPYTGKYCEVNGCDNMVCNNGVCAWDNFGVYCQCEACFTGSCCDTVLQVAACSGCNECVGGSNCTELRTQLCSCNPCPSKTDTCLNGVFKVRDRQCFKAPTTASNTFTLMFEQNLSNDPRGLEVYVASSTDDGNPRYVTVDAPRGTPDCSYSESAVIAPGEVHRFNVDPCLVHVYTEIENFGIRVRETNGSFINVYCINQAQYSADGWLALPDSVAGKYFVVISYSPIITRSQFGVVSITDGTIVNIHLSADSEDLTCAGPTCRYLRVTLDAYQTYQVSSAINDLSGTVIESSSPVHVYSGEQRAWVSPSPLDPYYSPNVPSGARSRDNLILECTSMETWGYTYAIVPMTRSILGYSYTEEAARIAGGTTTACTLYATINPPATYTTYALALNAANSYIAQFYMNADYNYFLACDQPVMVVEITESAIQGISLENDPSFIFGVSYSSYSNFYSYVPPLYSVTGGPYQYMFLRLAAVDPDYQGIEVNNALLYPTPPPVNAALKPWSQIYVPPGGAPASEYPQRPLFGAIFYLSNNESSSIIHPSLTVKFMCIVEGYDNRESFGIALGADVRPLRNGTASSFSAVLAAARGAPDLVLP